MSGKVVGKVLEHFPWTSHTALVIAIVFAEAADQDGSNMRIGVNRAARLARVCERTVQNHIQRFLKCEFLILVCPGGGRNRPAQYRVNLDWLEQQPFVLDLANPDTILPNTPEKVHKPRKIGAKAVAPISKETVQKGCNSSCTQPGPFVSNPHPNELGDQHWEIDLPLALQSERSALVSAALRAGRTAIEMRAAAFIAVTTTGVRSPAGFAISKLRDPTWKDETPQAPPIRLESSTSSSTQPPNSIDQIDIIRVKIDSLEFEEKQRLARCYNRGAGAGWCESYRDHFATYTDACERVAFTTWLRETLRVEMQLPLNS